jgi:hypothetical protein
MGVSDQKKEANATVSHRLAGAGHAIRGYSDLGGRLDIGAGALLLTLRISYPR